MQVSTSGQPSDQLDAAIAAGGAPVAVYHQQVNVGELPDLAGCDGDSPSAGRGGHTGSTTGRCWSRDAPAARPRPRTATLTVQPGSALPPGRSLAITFYFAHAGSVTLRLPVSRA